MPLKSDEIDAKAVTPKVAGVMLDATHWRNAGIDMDGCFSESEERALGQTLCMCIPY